MAIPLRALGFTLAVGLGVGCTIDDDLVEPDTVEADDGKADGAGVSKIEFNDVALARTDGRSRQLALEIPSGSESFAIYIIGAHTDAQYLVERLEGPNGETLVSERPRGFTADDAVGFDFGAGQFHSPNRSVAQAGFASLLVPNAPGIAIPSGTWRLRVRGVRVDAQGKVVASSDKPEVKVVIKARRQAASTTRKLKLTFYLTGSHGLTAASAADSAPFKKAITELKALYAKASIEIVVVETVDVDSTLQQLDESDLLAPFIPPTGNLDSVNVVIAESFVNGFAGYSTGTPGPMFFPNILYRAVFVSNAPPQPNVPSTPLGISIAHELGHYLGLPHTFDDDDVDPFSDTSENLGDGNVMEPGGIDLSRTSAPIAFSPQQIELLRRSPAVY